MGRLLVTIGTDGVTDWVRTPDGYKYNLGPISALSFVTGLVPRGTAKRALDEFLAQQEVLVSVDEGAMWELLAPHRARWSSDVSPSIPSMKGATRKSTMTFSDDLSAIENHIEALKVASAKKATNLSSGVKHLIKLAGKIKSPNQSDNSTYYNLGAPKVHEVGDKVAGLSYDVYAHNTELANQILAKAEETTKTIGKLASAGRRFNASRALADVRTVTDKVAGILTTDITQSWVKSDLDKLAARAEEIHGLFANAKV
jgi:hypothetical protein